MESSKTLEEDILLSFHSVSAKQGHFGSRTEYIAAEHRVLYKTWGVKRRLFGLLPPKEIPPTVDCLDIPEDITTEEDLLEYVRLHAPYWLRGRPRKNRQQRRIPDAETR